MKRAVAIFLVVFLLFLTPVVDSNLSFAGRGDRNLNTNKAEELRKYGFIEGHNGDLMTDKLLTRQQLAILICELNGVKDAASRYNETPRYKDLQKIPAWSRNYIAYCQKEGWMIGKLGYFDPTGVVSGKELAKALLNALGYQEVDWKKSIEFIKTLGIMVPDRLNMTRGQSFDVMWDAVSKPIMKSGETLGVKTGRLGEGTIAFRATGFEMVSLKTFRVHFNIPVDPESVEPEKLLIQLMENKNLEDLGGVTDRRQNVGIPHIVRAEAVLDGMAVDFHLASPIQHQVNIHYDVFGIRSANDNGIQHTMVLYSGLLNALDQSLPVVERVEIKGEKLLEITFSEPIQTLGTVEIDDGNSGITVLKIGARGLGTNKIGLRVDGTFQKGSTYTFRIKDFKDLAGYGNVHNTLTASIGTIAANQNPTVKAGGQTFDYVELVFGAPVKGLKKEQFFHSYDIYKAIKITKEDSFRSAEVKPYEFVDRAFVWFYDYTLPDAHAIPGEGAVLHIDGKDIVDGFGRALGKQQMSVLPQNQIDAPKVVAVELLDLKTLKVVFDRVVSEFKIDVVERQRNGNAFSDYVRNRPAKEFEIVLPYKAGGDLGVRIREAIDAGIGRRKQQGDANILVSVGDRIPPKVWYAVRRLRDGKASLIVAFDERVDKGALIASNYQIRVKTSDGERFQPLTNKPSFVGNYFSIVEIPLTDDEFRSMTQDAQILVKDIADATGNTQTEVVSLDEDIPMMVVSAVTRGKNEVIARIYGSVEVVNPEGFSLVANRLVVGSVSHEEEGVTTLNLLLANDEVFSPLRAKDPGFFLIEPGALATFTGEENSAEILYNNVYDQTKPYLKTIAMQTQRSIRLTFSEEIHPVPLEIVKDFEIEADGVKLDPGKHFEVQMKIMGDGFYINMLDVPLSSTNPKFASEAKVFKVNFAPVYTKDTNKNVAEPFDEVILRFE